MLRWISKMTVVVERKFAFTFFTISLLGITFISKGRCVVENVLASKNRTVFKIGIVPDSGDLGADIFFKAMRLAADRINRDPTILLESRIELLFPPISSLNQNENDEYSSFDSIKTMTSMIRQNAVAIIGPLSSTQIRATQPICDGLQLPQIAPWATDPRLSNFNHYKYLLKMSPPDNVMNRAVYDLVTSFMWTRVAILTDDTDFALNGVLEFIKLASSGDVRITSMVSFRATSPENINVTEQLKEIKEKGTTVVILHCTKELTFPVIQKAYEMGILKSKWVWIVTEFSRFPVNISEELTGLIGVRPSSGKGSLFKEFEAGMLANIPNAANQDGILAATQHGYDAVLTMGYALRDYLKANGKDGLNKIQNTTCVCENGTPLPWGRKLMEHLIKVKGPGVTSHIEFNEHSYPKNTDFDIVNLKPGEGWVKVAHWSEIGVNGSRLVWETHHVTFPGNTAKIPNDYRDNIRGTHLKIVTCVDPPFVTVKEDPNNTGVVELDGFVIDVLKGLQARLHFDYDIFPQKDNIYGSPQNGNLQEWSGMVKDVLDKTADLAVAAAFISKDRTKVIDFSAAYYDAGLSILVKKEANDNSESFWPFVAPFDINLWLLILGGTLFTTVALYVIEFLSPYGQYGVYVQRHDRQDQRFREGRFLMNIRNSFQFCYAAFVGINIDGVPRSFAGRLVGNYWYLVVFFITAGYTANFAAFLTVNQINQHSIKTLSELISQNKVKYGTQSETGISSFIDQRTTEVYSRMSDHINEFDTNLPSLTGAIEKVKNGLNGDKYAFIYDEPILNYIANNDPDCNLKVIGKPFRRANYGIMARKGSAFLDVIDSAILEMKEDGSIEDLAKKWFRRGNCYTDDDSDTGALPGKAMVMTAPQMAGIFYIGAAVVGVGFIILIGEFIFAAIQDIKNNKDTEGAPTTVSQALKIRFHHVVKATQEHIRKRVMWQYETPEQKSDNNKLMILAELKTVKYEEMNTKF